MDPRANRPAGIRAVITCLKVSAIVGSVALFGCSEPPDAAEVITIQQFVDGEDLRAQLLADCAARMPSDTSKKVAFLSTKFGQSCDNAKVAEKDVVMRRKYSARIKEAAENDRKLLGIK